MPYDPWIYRGTAALYTQGRPRYSYELLPTLSAALDLDGTGRLLDVGCGPGSVTLELAPAFEQVVAVDPDAEMLTEGRRRAAAAGLGNVRWIQALAEDLDALDLGPGGFRLVAFGQSFHWTDRERVAEIVYDLLDPGGAVALISHRVAGRPTPPDPGHPAIPHDVVRGLIDEYLGTQRRAGRGLATASAEPYADALARTRFGPPTALYAPGRPDIVVSIDDVLANYHSMSYAAPHLFGAALDDFDAALTGALTARSPSGRFWDWPGDTEILVARRR